MIKDYTIISSDDIFALEKRVLIKIKDGYELLGSIVVQEHMLLQAMILKEG